MWYRTSAIGIATLPKFAEEIVNVVESAFEPIPFNSDKCSSCGSSLNKLGDTDAQQFINSRKKYEDELRIVGKPENEIQDSMKLYDKYMSDLKLTKHCQNCGASTNKHLFSINFSNINSWFYKWSIDLPDRIRDDESLLGDFLKNTKLSLEEKIFEVDKRLRFLRFIQEPNPDNFGSYNWAANEIGLKNQVVNVQTRNWMLQTLRHELGHLFSLNSVHTTRNVLYEKSETKRLFDKVMLDYNIQLNSLNDLKSIPIEDLTSKIHQHKSQMFPNIKNETGLDELLARLSKSLLVNSKMDLIKGHDYSGSYTEQYAYYIYLTSEIETPTMMSDMIYFFNEDNLEKYRIGKFRNISKASYCKLLKDMIRSWNVDKILGYIEAIVDFNSRYYQKYADIFYTNKLDERPRIKQFILQLQKNLVIKINNYCNMSEDSEQVQE